METTIETPPSWSDTNSSPPAKGTAHFPSLLHRRPQLGPAGVQGPDRYFITLSPLPRDAHWTPAEPLLWQWCPNKPWEALPGTPSSLCPLAHPVANWHSFKSERAAKSHSPMSFRNTGHLHVISHHKLRAGETSVKLGALETFTQGRAKAGFQLGVRKTQEFILGLLFINYRLIFHMNNGQPTFAPHCV